MIRADCYHCNGGGVAAYIAIQVAERLNLEKGTDVYGWDHEFYTDWKNFR